MTGIYGTAQKLPALRLGRLGFGAVLVLVAAYVFYSQTLLCVSSTAVIGAQIATLVSPIEGTVSLARPLVMGQMLTRDAPLAAIHNTREDPFALHVTQQELEETIGRIRAVEHSASLRGGEQGAGMNQVASIETVGALGLPELYARRSSLEARLEADTEAYERRSSATLVTPVTGRLWEMRTTDGTATVKSETLMRIASCEHLLIFAQVNGRNFRRISIGTRAAFELEQAGERYEASVIQKLGSSDLRLERLPFAAPGLKMDTKSSSDVYIVILESPSLTAARAKSCELGSSGSVHFDVTLKPF